MFRDIYEVISSLPHVQGIADEHTFVYTGETILFSVRVLVDEGCEMEVKNMVEELLNQLGITEYTIDVTCVKGETEFRKVGNSELTIENVVRQYIHQHHECEHECNQHHEYEHECNHQHHECEQEYNHHKHGYEHHEYNYEHTHHINSPVQPCNLVRNTTRAQKLLISTGKLD